MKQAAREKTERTFSTLVTHRLRESLFILSIATALFLMVSFTSYQPSDPGWSSTGSSSQILNWGGRAGAFLSDVFLSLFGYIAFLLPIMIVAFSWIMIKLNKLEKAIIPWQEILLKALGFFIVVFSACGLSALYFKAIFLFQLPTHAGGILGDVIGFNLIEIFNIKGGTLFLVTALLCGTTFFSGFSWVAFTDGIGSLVIKLGQFLIRLPKTIENRIPKTEPIISEVKKERVIVTPKPQTPVAAAKPVIVPATRAETKPVIEKPVTKPPVAKKLESAVSIKPGTVPPLTLLDPIKPSADKAFSNTTFEELSQLVEQQLADFGVEVKVVAVHPGPVITRFELELAPGIKVSKISGLAKDIARSLSATSVRVVEVIPGKSVIGLELPNEFREVVGLRDILESQRYNQAKSPVSLALGKDISGHPVIVDLAKMPHLLVAGTTGSGKSVSINAMLLSMLFKSTPDQLRLILIDPKMLELSVYEGIPHLLAPVITDMKDAANALRWCVAEMDKRYKLMASMGVRNLPSYNQKVQEAIAKGQPLAPPPWLVDDNNQPQPLTSLPMIVVVADELADMMMVVGKKVEDLVTRIAQKARAAGIHLILATQRPSVDVITGLIKANVPTRIAFQVSSRIDSRTILDQQGAEQLLGNGDMLYLPPGTGVPVRVHGAFVTDEEVHRVVAAWQTSGKPEYIDAVTEGAQENAGITDGNTEELDALYDDALRVVTESRRASISLVQRRLKIGYNRAARIMEEMEAQGVVSSMDTNGTREVLAPPPVEVS